MYWVFDLRDELDDGMLCVIIRVGLVFGMDCSVVKLIVVVYGV